MVWNHKLSCLWGVVGAVCLGRCFVLISIHMTVWTLDLGPERVAVAK